MPTPTDEALRSILAFVSGALSPVEFEQRLYHSVELESLLTQAVPPPDAHTGHTLYHFLIALDFKQPLHGVMLHDALQTFLSDRGIAFTSSDALLRELELIGKATPAWLGGAEVDPYLSSLLAQAPEAFNAAQRKGWLKQQILERFRFDKRPPRWIQSPAWPMGKEGPKVFLGQVAVENYFHDAAAAYVFHDPATGACETVVQMH